MNDLDKVEAILRALSDSYDRFVYLGAKAGKPTELGNRLPSEETRTTPFYVEAMITVDGTPVPFGKISASVDFEHTGRYPMGSPTHAECAAALLAEALKLAKARAEAIAKATA